MNNNENPNNQVPNTNPQTNMNPTPNGISNNANEINPALGNQNTSPAVGEIPIVNDSSSTSPVNMNAAPLTPQNDQTNAQSNPAMGPTIETIPSANINNQSVPTNNTPLNNNEGSPNPQLVVNPTPVPNATQNTIPDNFNSVPKPPIFEENSPNKKGVNKKTLIIIIIFVLVAAVGFGVYYFLNTAKSSSMSPAIVTNDMRLELGETISDDVANYATVTGFNIDECGLDISEVSNSQVGVYKFYVICGNNKQEGSVIVDDTQAPELLTNEVVVVPNATVKIDDFVDSCLDASECTYKFVDEAALKTDLASIGEYEIEINASDEFNNETTVKAKLTVSNDAPVRYISCTSPKENVDSIYATLIDTYRFGIDSMNHIYNIKRNSQFTFEEMDDFNKAIESTEEDTGLYNRNGKVYFDNNKKEINIKADTTIEKMNEELKTTLTNDINATQMYLTIKGFSCTQN